MRIVVTGASGFIGKKLCNFLKDCGHQVVPVSRQESTQEGHVRVSNYNESPHGDVIVHLAEKSDPSAKNYDGDFLFNKAILTVNELLDKNYSFFLYVSSSAVYKPQNNLLNIDDPVEIRDWYTKTKLSCESLITTRGGCCIRLANVIGPSQPKKTVLSDILDQLDTPGPIIIRDGAPIVDFIPIFDVVSSMEMLCKKQTAGIFNVGSGRGLTVKSLASLAAYIHSDQRRDIIELLPSSISTRRVLDISKTVSDLGWRPSVTIEECLTQIIKKHP